MESGNILIIHHNDHDGKTAGAIVYQMFPNAECVQMNYDVPFPIENVKENEQIYIVDFSIEPDMMRRLLKKTENIIWIDHHISAIEKYKNFGVEIDGIREEGKSGCMHTWEYLHPEEQPPIIVQYVDDWDIWKHEYDSTRSIIYAMDMFDYCPTNKVFWKNLLKTDKQSQDIISILKGYGNVIKKYTTNKNRSLLQDIGYQVKFNGYPDYKFFAANIPRGGKDSFDSIEEWFGEGYIDIFVCYYHNGDTFVVSLYTDKEDIDVSKICEEHKGGGHPGAAGFVAKDLPFKRLKI